MVGDRSHHGRGRFSWAKGFPCRPMHGRCRFVQDFRKLSVWQNSVDFAIRVYEATSLLPRSERFGLTAQMRAAAVSVSSNIAEGCGRPTRRDLARFLGIAIGSACEVESQIYLCQRLALLDEEVVESLSGELSTVKRQLIALYERVRATDRKAIDEVGIGRASDDKPIAPT